MLWWNIFTVVDVLLLLIYDQYKTQLGPETVFYINNVIWFLGLDIYHLYFTLALWTRDVPSIKEVPRRIVFYPMKPISLEPRRPKLEQNVCGAEAPNPDNFETLFEEVCCYDATCKFQNCSPDKPGWKGKGGGKRKGQKETKTGDNEQESISKTNFNYIFKRPSASALPAVSD